MPDLANRQRQIYKV